MQIASWNMSHAVKRSPASRSSGWEHLRSLGADLAMVQEAGLPMPPTVKAHRVAETKLRTWGTAVVTFGPQLEDVGQLRPSWDANVTFSIPTAARPGTLTVALCPMPDGVPLVVASLYGMLRYADQSVLLAASDLLPIFDTRLRRRVIVAGDWNIHTHSNDPAERARAGPILGVLRSFGLHDLVAVAMTNGTLTQGVRADVEDCPCDDEVCTHIRTHRHPGHGRGEMANNDYMYATEDIADHMKGLIVMNGDHDVAWRHSDHAPLLGTFEL